MTAAVAFSDILGFGLGFEGCGLGLEGHGLGGCGLANITAAAAAVAYLLLILPYYCTYIRTRSFPVDGVKRLYIGHRYMLQYTQLD